MKIARVIGVQLLTLFVTVFVASVLIYGGLYLTPGNGALSTLAGPHPTQQEVEKLRAEYHLNDSFPTQYVNWVTRAVQGNFGESFVYKEPVVDLIKPRLAVTGELVLFAGLLIVVGGIGLGVLAGLRPKRAGPLVIGSTTVGLAIPQFVAATLLVWIFAVGLGWFPVLGAGTGFADRIYHLILPAIALGLSGLAYMTILTGSEVRHQSTEDHVTTARVRGIPASKITRKHILRNALIPIVTVAGITFASLLASVALVESVFRINGIGSYLITSITQKDFAVVQAIALIFVVAFVVINAIVDILYAVLDPRLRRPAV